MASKIGKPILADSPTIQRTRFGAPRKLVELYQTRKIVSEVKLEAGEEIIVQQVEYDWYPNLVPFVINGDISLKLVILRGGIRNGHQKR